MKIISTDIERIYYPVGSHIQYNISLIEQLAKVLKKVYKNEHINLICTGSSGAIVAGIIALNIPNSEIHHVRKEGENAHRGTFINNIFAIDCVNVIVDDFISTGKTMERIYNSLCEVHGKDIKIHCVCVTGEMKPLPFEIDTYICSYK